MFDNPPHPEPGPAAAVPANGAELRAEEITDSPARWTCGRGCRLRHFRIDGEPVRVVTCVHPSAGRRDGAHRIAAGRARKLQVALDFPYPTLQNGAWVGRLRPGRRTPDRDDEEGRAAPQTSGRVVDGTTYHASLAWSSGGALTGAGASPHRFHLSATGTSRLEFVCAFSPAQLPDELPTVKDSLKLTADHWAHFWSTGGAIDLSGSKDPRWRELERRIVALPVPDGRQSAGSFPSAETGLMGLDPWRSQFHMEMVWWHLAHYALWDRWPMAERALGCYQRFAPAARALAAQLGYKGPQVGEICRA